MLVKFWGTRGSIPTPGRLTEKYGGNTSCVEVRVADKLLIFDCGSGIRDLGISYFEEFGTTGIEAHIFISHTHWDHIQGFPFFPPAFVRGNTFYVYGTAARRESISSLLSGQMQPEYFPAKLDDMAASFHYRAFKDSVDLGGGLVVETAELYHPGMSHGFAIHWEGKKVIYATDNELNLGLKLKDEAAGYKAGYVDPRQTLMPHLIPFFQGADLVIADCQYTDEEYAHKATWGHASVSAVMTVMTLAQVKRLAIFHHDPLHSDRVVDEIVVEAKNYLLQNEIYIDTFGAREGMVLKI